MRGGSGLVVMVVGVINDRLINQAAVGGTRAVITTEYRISVIPMSLFVYTCIVGCLQ